MVESLDNHLTPLPFQISDLLFLLVCVPFTAADYALTSVWYFGEVWCKLNQTFIICTAYVSIYTLVLMATDRSVCSALSQSGPLSLVEVLHYCVLIGREVQCDACASSLLP